MTDTIKPTMGQVSTDLLKSSLDDTHSAHEQMREQLSDYDKGIYDCLERYCKAWPHKDFYLVVVTKRERLLKNVFRNYFFGCHACPTPTYDQTVYHYHAKDDYLEFLWVLPSKQAAFQLLHDPSAFPPKNVNLPNS